MSLTDVYALLDRVRDVVDDTQTRADGLLYAARRAGAKAEEVVGEYPEPSGKPLEPYYDRVDRDGKPYKSKFKSAAQQGFVMTLIAKGKIPYRRTGRLGRSILSDAQTDNFGVIISVGTNLSYAPLVLDKERQSHYHEGTWTPLQDKLKQGKAEIVGVFQTSLTGWLQGYLAKK